MYIFVSIVGIVYCSIEYYEVYVWKFFGQLLYVGYYGEGVGQYDIVVVIIGQIGQCGFLVCWVIVVFDYLYVDWQFMFGVVYFFGC